jgi:hypothetical protein
MRYDAAAMQVVRCTLLAAALLARPAAAAAHHGIINFDLNREIAVAGVVTEFVFVNPHSWLYVDVTGEDGRVAAWKCELRGATVLRRSGWTPELFRPGTRVSITGAPDRFEANTCYLGTVELGDGTRIDRYGQITRHTPAAPTVERPRRLPNGQPNISGDWAAEQRVLTDPRGMSGAFLPLGVARRLEPGAVPEGTQAFPGTRGTAVSRAEDPVDEFWNRRPSIRPLTEAGTRAMEGFDGASADNPRLRCEPTNILFDWTFESDVNRIVQEDDQVRLVYGSMGLARTVYLNVREHPPDLVPSRAGQSIGRWEDDVLIVDTVGFEPGILSADGRLPHSDRLHVVERFWLDPGTGALRRSYVAEDPLYFEGQYTGADVVHVSDVPFQVAPCDDRSFKSSGTAGRVSWLPWTFAGLAGALVLCLGVMRWRRRRDGQA